ncbi:Nurim [Blattella germanica]|nr:Nurim [Blattella germanica]
MFQHSAMAKPLFKRAVYSSGFQVIERSIYVIMTSVVLQCVMTFWQPISWIKIWDIDSSGTLFWTLYTAVHCFAWCVIYIGTLMMDIPEMLGVKQVYYNLRGLPDPMTFKSKELQRFYLHMRHPSFTGFCLLLWFYPVMSLDRLLLAGLWTLYMMVAWNVDHFDYLYQSQQLKRKQFEMEHPKMNYHY